VNRSLSDLADQLEQDQSTLERELAEIELLLRQTATEAERHEARRVQTEERLATIERDHPPSAEDVADARNQVLSQTRRATIMQAQLEVLSGKQRALQRYHDKLADLLPVLRGNAVAGADEPRVSAAGSGNGLSSREVLAAQEGLRREIARQMHDGPAQSMANIALQAQVVQRLFDQQPEMAKSELNSLVAMVQHSLEATKNFIFEVRPMVLDDLGLVPTLRRSTAERSRRSGVPVRFESVGADRRLESDLESTLFRIVDEALAAYIASRPPEVVVKLDWNEKSLHAAVRGREERSDSDRTRAAVAAARHKKTLPAALASMMEQQEEEDAMRAQGLSESAWAELQERASTLGISMKLSSDRSLLEASVELPD
jgi:two-component system sensor histidine kinase DegS